MPIVKSSLQDIKNYFEHPALNQSELKKYLVSLNEIMYNNEKEQEPSRLLFTEEEQYNIIGSAVDLLLTGTREEFETVYFISSCQKPSDLLISILKHTMSMIDEANKEMDALIFFKDELLAAANAHDYQRNWKDETRVNKIIELGAEYFEELKLSGNKTVIDIVDMQQIETIVESFKQAYPKLFGGVQVSNDFTIYHQYPIYWNWHGSDIKTKALLDIMVHKASTNEFYIYDLKTTGGLANEFQNSVTRFRYDIQAAWYITAVAEKFGVPMENIKFKFLVQSKLFVGKPVEYIATKEFVQKAITGLPSRTTMEVSPDGTLFGIPKRAVLGIDTLLEIRQFYLDNNFSMDYANNKIELY